MIDEISRWCAAYFDEGQAVWRAPSRDLGFYAGWKAAMAADLNAEAMGVRGFRASVAGAPDDPLAAIARVVAGLGIPDPDIGNYLFRALFDVRGWASFARRLDWTAALAGGADDTVLELLAVRVVWGWALFLAQSDPRFHLAWRASVRRASRPAGEAPPADAVVSGGLDRLRAREQAFQSALLTGLERPRPREVVERPAVQAAFCIDVRSEPYRRSLEEALPCSQTIGFAGFFGFPIEYVPIGRTSGGAQCPVLLRPRFVVREGLTGVGPERERRALALRGPRRRFVKAWKSFKLSAVSSFAFVETLGLGYAAKLIGDALGLSRPVGDPRYDGLDAIDHPRLGPRIEPETLCGRAFGFGEAEQVDMAEAVLTAMSLTRGFARLVLLAGHGSTTVNNPHAAGLDCGACGGHTGEANARVAAAILNRGVVRASLAERGIAVPEDTWFVAGLHDTTTDAVRLFDTHLAPTTHQGDLARLRSALDEASRATRMERAGRLGLRPGEAVHRKIAARARDWSEVRPEWGLAGCAGFVAAPRSLTRGLDLGGRVFLHDYDWRRDRDFATLELIMTAPMIVATWISLQYYASTVNNPVFGAGEKVLHNIVGAVGVLEGNAGDLKAGLPLQSVHDGARFVHEPLRLSVVLAAPCPAIEGVVARHAAVAELVDNGWLHLFAVDQAGEIKRRMAASGDCWTPWGASHE